METTAQLRALLQPPDARASEAHASAHLRDAFPSSSTSSQNDADVAKALAQALEAQTSKYDALRTDLRTSSEALEGFLSTTQSKLSNLSSRARSLHDDHLQLEDELIDYREALEPSVPSSASPSKPSEPPKLTLLRNLEAQQSHLRALLAARDWYASLQGVEAESLAARQRCDARDWDGALEAWRKVVSLCDGRKATKGETHGIMRSVAVATWHFIDASLAKVVIEALDELKWPQPIRERLEASDPGAKALQKAFVQSLKLQRAAEGHRRSLATPQEPFPPEGLSPIRALVQPLILRFRYHFDGERQTNRLDKPEWYFTHVLNLFADHERFIRHEVQALLVAGGFPWVNAMTQVSQLLINQIERKVRNTVPQLLSMPAILAHTIYQALQFDEAVKSRGLTPLPRGSSPDDWRGTADVVLGNEGWFDAWVEAEKKFVDSKYYEIIGAADAWQVAEDYSPEDDDLPSFHPTNSAVRVRDLFDQVTERYKPLLTFAHRAPFLLAIQVPLLEAYIARIASSIDAFESLSFGLMRAVPGSIGEGVGARVTAGVAGAQRLTRAGLSARWMAAVCNMWDDDVLFLELCDGLKRHTLQKPELRSAASSLLASAKSPGSDDAVLFRSFAKRFDELAAKSEALLVRHIVREVTNELKAYVAQRWNPEDPPLSPDGLLPSLEISGALVPAITLWSALIRSLHSNLPITRATPLFRQIASEVQDFLITRIVLTRSMTAITFQGGRQFAFDVLSGWIGTIESSDLTSGGVRKADVALRKLLDVGALLSLPPNDKAASAEGEETVSFTKIMQIAFGNDHAEFKTAMQRIGVKGMAKSEVQAILRRRPECWR